ncbi:MAG: long-chain fatty acid--CoA ligase [Rhodocyclaceae bacterium]|jgi:long-chain acyl-CoA synthetase|nr:long-chain fatty acid--CoA ligase [Rhodocyclaceae bacterium]
MYLTQGLLRAVQRKPEATATVCGARRRTFRQMADRVARLAAVLRSLGVAADDRVAILSLNSDRYLEAYLAIWWAGGAANPVNIRWSAAEIAYSLDDCATQILIVDDAFADTAKTVGKTSKALKHLLYWGEAATPAGMSGLEALIDAAEPVANADRGGDDLAAVCYTGGTTGFPKGVMLSHANLISSALGVVGSGESIGPVCLHAAPMFHAADMLQFISALIVESTHVVIPAFEPLAAMRAIQDEGVTDTLIVPTMIQMLADHPQRDEFNLTSLQRLFYGASVISEAVLVRATRALPGTKFIQVYGMTELSPLITVLASCYHTEEGRRLGKHRSAGRASIMSEVRVVGPDDTEMPRGEVGEVVARGPQMMLGYWNKPEETAAATRGGWMHTGDGAYMDDEGFVYIVDRMKDMIVSGGENVYSAEVENAVASHPAVASCAVIGIPHDLYGEAVHAVVVLRAGALADDEEIRRHCRERIAGYKCPRSIEFSAALPMSGAGKILKRELRKSYWEGRERKV